MKRWISASGLVVCILGGLTATKVEGAMFLPTLNWDAANPANTDDLGGYWQNSDDSTVDSTFQWRMSGYIGSAPTGGPSLVTAASGFAGITKAYRFSKEDKGTGGALAEDGTWTNFEEIGLPSDPTTQDATFELWIKPDRLQWGQKIIMEIGGAWDGSSLLVRYSDWNTELIWRVLDSTWESGSTVTNYATATLTLPTNMLDDYMQVVAVYDHDAVGDTDTIRLMVNGGALDSGLIDAGTDLNDWAGIGPAFIGNRSGADPGQIGGNVGDLNEYWRYHGEMATIRFYQDHAFDVSDAAQNFRAMAIPEPSSLIVWSIIVVLTFGGVGWRRKRKA